MEKLAVERQQRGLSNIQLDDGRWESVLSDSRAQSDRGIPTESRRLSEVPRPLMRLECLKCFRVLEVQHADAVRLYGPHAIMRDVSMKLLDNGCPTRDGTREDGCWPRWIVT